MIVYITDEGNEMEADDFLEYVKWKVLEAKRNNEDWRVFLDADYWGDNLLITYILNCIEQ